MASRTRVFTPRGWDCAAFPGSPSRPWATPPLREAADRDAMLDGIADGTVDVIATDHAPHHADEKLVEFDRAPFGIVGLETCVPLVFDRLVHAGKIGVRRAIELLTAGPARVFRLPGVT